MKFLIIKYTQIVLREQEEYEKLEEQQSKLNYHGKQY